MSKHAEKPQVEKVIGTFLDGRLSRRKALAQLVAAGLPARAAYAALGISLASPAAQAQKLDKAALEALVIELNKVVTHPDVVSQLQSIDKKSPSEKQLQSAMETVLKVSARPEFKIASRESMRASLRIFEKDDTTGAEGTLMRGVATERKLVTSPPYDSRLPIQQRFEDAGIKLKKEWEPPQRSSTGPAAGTLCASFGIGLCVSYGDEV